jgi:hypothetical protein
MKISHDSGLVRSHSLARPVSGSGREPGSGTAFDAVPPTVRIEPRNGSRSLAGPARDTFEGDMRVAKVVEMREAILQGRFRVSAEAIADGMIVEASGLVEAISSGRRV